MNISFEDFLDMARTVWGEARGEPQKGKIAVAWVIINRYRSGKWFAGSSISLTCRKPQQFSCWNFNDPNSDKVARITFDTEPTLRTCAEACLTALSDPTSMDPTSGATHYYNPDTVERTPQWANLAELTARIGHHAFFKGVK